MSVNSYKPKNEKRCIKKVQANRDYHECDYKDEPYRNRALSDDDSYFKSEASTDYDGYTEFFFEDGYDDDFDDLRFAVKFSGDKKECMTDK